MLKRLKKWIGHFKYGFFGGMKAADDVIFRQTTPTQAQAGIVQEQHENRVSKDLLTGKETQQVRELRYRTYKVDRESKSYEYFSPYKAKKRDASKPAPKNFDSSDGRNVIVIQDNYPISESVVDGLEQVGKRGNRQKYWIAIDRDGSFTPRYRLEEYTLRLVVKETDDENVAMLEFYVSKYPNEEDFKSKGFISEIKDMLEVLPNKSDITAFTGVHFITNCAYGADDMIEYRFRKPYPTGVSEYEGNYVLRFRAGIVVNGYDKINDYKEKSLDDKYLRHETKHPVIDLTGNEPEKEYVCEHCGKVVKYDTKAMDRVKYEDRGTNTTEYLDMQMSKETVGKFLCKDCLIKYINEMNKWKNQDTHS